MNTSAVQYDPNLSGEGSPPVQNHSMAANSLSGNNLPPTSAGGVSGVKRDASELSEPSQGDAKKPSGETCYVCGGIGHMSMMCTSPKGSNDVCHNCGGFAHIAAMCPSPKGVKEICHICHGQELS